MKTKETLLGKEVNLKLEKTKYGLKLHILRDLTIDYTYKTRMFFIVYKGEVVSTVFYNEFYGEYMENQDEPNSECTLKMIKEMHNFLVESYENEVKEVVDFYKYLKTN